MTQQNEIILDRREAVARILEDRGDALLITGLGSTTWDAAAVGDHPHNFYLWGAMGGAITGDGEMLMGLGGLATIAVQRPANLGIVVIDNESYGETGMQKTHTHHGVDLAGLAAAAGFSASRTIYSRDELEETVSVLYAASGPVLAVVKVKATLAPTVLPPRDGPYLRDRFRGAVLGDRAAG